METLCQSDLILKKSCRSNDIVEAIVEEIRRQDEKRGGKVQ
jgi:hypothetical protein